MEIGSVVYTAGGIHLKYLVKYAQYQVLWYARYHPAVGVY